MKHTFLVSRNGRQTLDSLVSLSTLCIIGGQNEKTPSLCVSSIDTHLHDCHHSAFYAVFGQITRQSLRSRVLDTAQIKLPITAHTNRRAAVTA